MMMSSTDRELSTETKFAEEIADLLHRTVSSDPPIRALTVGRRVVVAPSDEDGVVGSGATRGAIGSWHVRTQRG